MDKMYEERIYQEQMGVIAYEREFIPVKNTGATLSKDGDQWCWLLGVNLMEGIAGFGDTPYKAMIAFNKEFYGG